MLSVELKQEVCAAVDVATRGGISLRVGNVLLNTPSEGVIGVFGNAAICQADADTAVFTVVGGSCLGHDLGEPVPVCIKCASFIDLTQYC